MARGVPGEYRFAPSFAGVSALLLLVSACLVFIRPRLGYWLGLIAGASTLHWFSRIELPEFPVLNSWILFNFSARADLLYGKLRVFVFVTAAVATLCSLTRLLPSSWTFRTRPVRERNWPALLTSAVVTAAWYAASASPYRISYIVDAVPPQSTILHLSKSGLQFHETTITVDHHSGFYVCENDERLFRYCWAVRQAQGRVLAGLGFLYLNDRYGYENGTRCK